MKRALAALALTATLALAACGGDDDPPLATAVATSATSSVSTASVSASASSTIPATASPAASVPAPSKPAPTVDLLWMWGSSEDEFVRFVAEVKNPGAKTLSGTELQWVAMDSAGVVVGSVKRPLPDIGAGGSLFYAGGAGSFNLTGKVASVKVTVTDPGKYTDSPFVALAVSDVTVKPTSSSFNLYKAPAMTDVSAVVTSPDKPTDRTKVGIVVVLKDSAGKVVGATFGTLDSAPSTLDPGTKVRFVDTDIESTAVAATAAVYAYLQP